ncbi:MAG: CHAT domain-containing protein [Nitrososphaera sp.]|nr:CHAT domain-containing protein [Nitrososphaera sp.]
MDYINYHVEVTPDGMWVRIRIYRPDGEEAGQPHCRFGLSEVQDEVLSLSDKVAQGDASREEIERLGELLFGALFHDAAVAENFRYTFRQARERKQGLRIELDFDETQMPEVAALPWEFIRAPQTAGYPGITLAIHPGLVIGRRRSLWEPPRRVTKTTPWHILLAVAAPNDENLGSVAYEEVLQDLQLLIEQSPQFAPMTEPVLQANPINLDEALGTEPDIFHFIGHGQFILDTNDPHGELALVGQGGWAEWYRDNDFASLLERHVPSVVFLQACEGGTLGSALGLTGVASKIVQHNAPVVVAMLYPISNAAAVTFAHKFYERLAAGDPVDKAAQEGRRRLWFKYPGRREFATPVLFMRTPDGRLFAKQSGDQQAERNDRLLQPSGDVITATGGATVVNRSPGASVTPPSTPLSAGGINYNNGLAQMRELIKKHASTMLNEFLTLESRLRENLRSAGLFGETETVRAERAQIVNALNNLAQRAKLSKTFNDLFIE